jgi:RNA polymerase-binding transcription factor DksA
VAISRSHDGSGPPEALLAAARESLLDERARLLHQLESLGVGADALENDHNFADSGQVAAEVGEARVLSGSIVDQLRDVDHALAKLDGGNYGLCESCGAPIAEPRLEAMPATRWCIGCAASRA